MSGIITVVVMSLLLGAASFGIGMVPLFFRLSKDRIAYVSTVGNGLILGAALGVIIPEGVETLVEESSSKEFPSTIVAMSLLAGFIFMMVVEQFTSGHSHHAAPPDYLPLHTTNGNSDAAAKDPPSEPDFTNDEDFDATLRELEGNGESREPRLDSEPTVVVDAHQAQRDAASRAKAFSLTFGLVIHSVADGLALGASALPRTGAEGSSQLSIIVFLALIIHKAPTTLALTMSLLGTSITRVKCQRYIAIFCSTTPISAIVAFGLLTFLGGNGESSWTGTALLVSGGTFLYVATVIQQPGGHHGPREMSDAMRAGLVILGMFLPFLLGKLVGHSHGHGDGVPTPPVEQSR